MRRGHGVPVEPGQGDDLELGRVHLAQSEQVAVADEAVESAIVLAVQVLHGHVGHERSNLGSFDHLPGTETSATWKESKSKWVKKN